MALSLDLQTARPEYERLLREVFVSNLEASTGKYKWFEISSLRAKVYAHVRDELKKYSKSASKTDQSDIVFIIDKVWRICCYTAPVIISQIAPELSYVGREGAFFTAAILSKKTDLSVFPEIQIGIDLFRKTLQIPLKANEGMAVLCNLFQGVHVFVIERRGGSCFFYQSYFGNTKKYSFSEYLRDDQAHIAWSSEDVISRISVIVDRAFSFEVKGKAYQELFFTDFSELRLYMAGHKAQLRPFLFVETRPYPLR